MKAPTTSLQNQPATWVSAALIALAIFCVACFSGAANANERSKKQARLQQLRAEIGSLSQNIQRQRSKRSAAQQQLAIVEQDLARRSKRLYNVRTELSQSKAQLKTLERKVHNNKQLLVKQREALRSSLQSAWMAGRHQELKLMLSQDNAAAFGRMLAYYRYANVARREHIVRYQKQASSLKNAQQELVTMQKKLGGQLSLAEQLVEELQADRQARAQAIAEIDRELRQRGGQLGQLKEQEAALQNLLKKLARTIKRLPPPVEAIAESIPNDNNRGNRETGGVDIGSTTSISSTAANTAVAAAPRKPFRQLRGKLPWPSSGELRKPRFSRLKGVLINTNRSADVRSVAYGQVVFADWLQHFGMLVVVDHGSGYLSLYGHNEVLLVDVGDQVTPGEVLARVGNSGGRQQNALYFELRHKSRVLRPQRWLDRAG